MVDPKIVHDPDRPAAVVACLERTRSAVLNVLVFVGAGIAASGWVLGNHDPDAVLPWGFVKTRQVALGVLAGLVAVSYAILRIIAGREALRDPARRASRFFKGRVAASCISALAVPLGFAYGWFVDPLLGSIAPFWIAALALGFLALPRGPELDDFDEPMPEG
jgi:hypothetical protein